MDNQLSTDLFYGMILSGAKQVIINESELNKLNVFPVADRDTGTNLASMMRYIVDNLSPTKDTSELLHQLSQHGLIGSSGNSGLIFSQFFYGLTISTLREKTIIKIQDLVSMFNNGYKSAYASVSNPKAGTILSVMERLALSVHDVARDTKITLIEGLRIAVEKARETLKDSINQLEVLKRNNVVDAGAQGFIHFVDGMLKFLYASDDERSKILAEKNAQQHDMLKLDFEFEDMSEKPNYRYCFETVVRIENAEQIESQGAYLETLGDSMVIGRGRHMAKLHIHTNHPELITAKLSNYGDILYQKIDNMMLQYSIASSKARNKIAIIVDTMADISQEWLWQNNIVTIPLQVKINGSAFLDKYSINYKQMLACMNNANNKVCTAAPSAAIVARNLHFLEQFYESFIIIPVAKSLSSTYDVIVNQARKFHSRHITVIDSCAGSASLGLLVAYANQLVESNNYTHNEIVDKLEEVKIDTNILILVNSLDGLIKSGRLPKSLGFVARLLRLKPILRLDSIGKPNIIGISFTKRGAWSKMLNIITNLQKQNKVNSLAIVHSASENMVELFSQYIIKQSGLTPLYATEVSAVSGVHTAENSLAIAYSVAKIKL